MKFVSIADCGTDATCSQAAWQGRWGMWSFIASTGMLVATLASIWLIWKSVEAARHQQQQEFRAILRLELKDAVLFAGEIRLNIDVFNYGRTPASNLNGSCFVNVNYRAGAHIIVLSFSNSVDITADDVHRDTPEPIQFFGNLNILQAINGGEPENCEISVLVIMTYKDIYWRDHEVSKGYRFKIVFDEVNRDFCIVGSR